MCQPPPPPHPVKKTFPCAILPPPFLVIIIKIYSPLKKGWIRTMSVKSKSLKNTSEKAQC